MYYKYCSSGSRGRTNCAVLIHALSHVLRCWVGMIAGLADTSSGRRVFGLVIDCNLRRWYRAPSIRL
jgi:hypothetical protein